MDNLVSNPNFHGTTIFENLTVVHMLKIKCYFGKPIYVGMDYEGTDVPVSPRDGT